MSTFFFFNDTATTEIYTLSLHDALPICKLIQNPQIRASDGLKASLKIGDRIQVATGSFQPGIDGVGDRKSTRLNSSHSQISYAVFCLKKKKKDNTVYGSSRRDAHTL